MEIDPVIAIHGVGDHQSGDIRTSLAAAFRQVSLNAEIAEFNWNTLVDHSEGRILDAVRFLGTTARSISQAAAQPIHPSDGHFDRVLYQAEQALHHGVLRPVVAAGLTLVLFA